MESTRILSTAELAQAPVDPQRTQTGSAPPGIALACLAGNSYALSTATSREHFLLRVASGGPAASGPRRPLNLCLAIDRSGSMDGEPLEYVKQACGHILDLLGPEDVISIVTFEDAVDVVVPAVRVLNRELLKQHIQRIIAGRTTNLYDGLVSAFAQVSAAASPSTVNRVLLLTDGEPTAGIRDFQSLVTLVGEKKDLGLTVTALGFGPEYNEELLAGMARRSGGSYYYIPRPELIPEVFRKELQSLLTLQATDLRLRLRLPRWVSLRQVYGHQASYGPGYAEVALADLEAGRTISVVAELELGPRPSGTYRVAVAELNYQEAGRAGTCAAAAVLEFTPDAALVTANANPVVQQEVELAQASRALERTVMGMRTQQISSVTVMAELERTQTLLARGGRLGEATQVGQVLSGLRAGSSEGAEKTLIGTVLDLDQGKS
ncbi:MAG TPA: VWA domain-containing protein [Armatimonadota bacterium]|jgi:Ca-activated chloride channel family protein